MPQNWFLFKLGEGLEGELKEFKEGIETSFPKGRLQTCLARQGVPFRGIYQQGRLPTRFTSEEGLGIHHHHCCLQCGSDFPLCFSAESSGTFLALDKRA